MIAYEINQTVGRKLSRIIWRRWFLAIARGLGLKKRQAVSVAIIGEVAMKRLNRTYRGKNRVTDVLSFGERDGAPVPDSDHQFLGEIIICYPQAVRQARELGHPLTKELAWLLTHGYLHLLGYDHQRPNEARLMKRLEQKILSAGSDVV